MRHSLFFAASAIALLTAGAAVAQSAVDARLGNQIRGRLEEGDARTRGEGAYRYDDYRVHLRAGQRLQAELRSEDFDAYLEVFAEGETASAALARPAPMEAATSPTVTGFSNWRWLPSGRVILIMAGIPSNKKGAAAPWSASWRKGLDFVRPSRHVARSTAVARAPPWS